MVLPITHPVDRLHGILIARKLLPIRRSVSGRQERWKLVGSVREFELELKATLLLRSLGGLLVAAAAEEEEPEHCGEGGDANADGGPDDDAEAGAILGPVGVGGVGVVFHGSAGWLPGVNRESA